ILGIFIIGIILAIMARVERGLWGVVLAGLTGAILIYWLREVVKMVKSEWGKQVVIREEWRYDIIDESNGLTVVAEVPGPEGEVKVRVIDRELEIKGGNNFKKTFKLNGDMEISQITYVNGVLQVKLRKRSTI
ncbi:MAG: Hsp20/alpha crystallin family protein, partial [Nitrososphaerales archaeon]|nr:Hsp20/alpha crystallin family protein [Nitrososphaerales archaeon]